MGTGEIQIYQEYKWQSLGKPIKEGTTQKWIEGGKNNLKYSVNPRIERNIIQNGQDKQKTNSNM